MCRHYYSALCLTLLLIGCVSSAPSVTNNQAEIASAGSELPANVATTNSSYTDFADWRTAFIRKALARGINEHTVMAIMANAHYMDTVVKLDTKQPEFSKHIWSYLDSAVSPTRVAQGRQHFEKERPFLVGLERRFGVPAEIITAIWGLETSYGANTGNSDLPSALATLAYDGRRRTYAENQLLAMMQLVQAGDIMPEQLRGSWAGGMGQTQFIPTTYAAYSIDGNSDGRRNLWDSADALASTANYLASSGWQAGVPWGIAVALPSTLSDEYVDAKLSWSQWQQLGLHAVMQDQETALAMNTQAKLWLPGGVKGPALLTTDNFDVIKVYNNASSYALAVGLLSDAIAGHPSLSQQAVWPREQLPLSTAQVRQLQQRLQTLGFDPGAADGILGANTRRAFRDWQRSQGIFADGFISVQSAQGLL